jgi:hypothetical protein
MPGQQTHLLFKTGSDGFDYITCMIFKADASRVERVTPPLSTPPVMHYYLAQILMLLLMGLAKPSLALEPNQIPLQEKLLQPQVSVDDVARKINQQPQWRVLAAEPTVEDDKTMYKFKLLNKERGRVQVIMIDPDQPQLEQLD